MGTHNLHFRGYNPYFGGVKPSCFMVLGIQGFALYKIILLKSLSSSKKLPHLDPGPTSWIWWKRICHFFPMEPLPTLVKQKILPEKADILKTRGGFTRLCFSKHKKKRRGRTAPADFNPGCAVVLYQKFRHVWLLSHHWLRCLGQR